MNEKKFWKIVYLYLTKYNYEVIYYRPEKHDVWLINNDNELVRFLYSSELKTSDVDASVYNVIKNQSRLKKVFKLSSLKIKNLHIAESYDESIQEYKKYKVSGDLLIERILLSEKNINKFVKKNDEKFVSISVDTDRYKQKVVNSYLNKDKNNFLVNFHFNFLGVFLVLIFLVNYLSLYYSSNKLSLYSYIDYNYQEIISGKFYRLFTDFLVFDSINQLIVVTVFIVSCSIVFGEEIRLNTSIIILLLITFLTNLFVLFGSAENVNAVSLAFFGLLGSLFILELNRRNNNLKFIYALILPVAYLIATSIVGEMNFPLYIFSFIIGIFIQIALLKDLNVKIAYAISIVFCIVGVAIVLTGANLKNTVNNYYANKFNNNFSSISLHTSTEQLERELNSVNKSAVTYYKLGLIKITTSSVNEGKKIFLDGIEFDKEFAPLYYQLSLIEKAENNNVKSLEYIEAALKLEPDNKKYKDLKNELT